MTTEVGNATRPVIPAAHVIPAKAGIQSNMPPY